MKLEKIRSLSSEVYRTCGAELIELVKESQDLGGTHSVYLKRLSTPSITTEVTET